jgi:serine-type D-Ala-D-Ala carboxypeptidase (penicillin-binding protein 5/6)
MESRTGKVLWSRDMDTPRYPASTTKILTCLLMLENLGPEDIITAPADVAKVRESSMNLRPGEKVRVKNMAYALMLRSANDGCYAVAVQMDGSVAAFAKRMNERAVKMGCKNTHFENPNGLNNPNHKTSAFDLCLMGREAMKREDFQTVVRTKKKVIDRSINFLDRALTNRNKYLWKDQTADGIKTGWTIPAGHTYVGSVKRGEMRVITSLLKASSWLDDHTRMVKWAFDNYELELMKAAGPVETSDLGAGVPSDLRCTLEVKQDVYSCLKKGESTMVESTFESSETSRPYKPGDLTGTWVIKDSDGFVQRIPVYATSSEPPLTPVQSATKTILNPYGLIALGTAGVAVAGTLYVRGKSRTQL